MNSKIRVAVIYGGRSTEHSVSCVSAGAIMANLDPAKYEIIPIGITKDGAWTQGVTSGLEIYNRMLPEVAMGDELTLSLNPATKGTFYNLSKGGVHAQVDVILPVLHGPFGEDGTIQGLFELSGVPYAGAGVLASAASMDKEYTKKLLAAEGIPVAAQVVLTGARELQEEEKHSLGLPVFVKPARGGSSIGVSRVSDWSELAAALDVAFATDSKVLIEPEIVGQEVEIGVLQYADGSLLASEPALLAGIADSEDGFYSFDTKYLDDVVTAQIPAPLEPAVTLEIKEMALEAFRALDCAGLSRVDFFVTESGAIVNEVNTFPGFTPISMYPQVLAHSGVEYTRLLDCLIEQALGSAA
ncbi:D-alanine--D-alanine ligase family protein [Corynebacterium flavescens]|uniref:D-alanine--D-alanine ligase family protein n=1 Tax=Corynebacterium flavescens TaxID=28028 RepID=UPI002898B1C8|nr:D-alanine--D-alanine ligase family protein [Corynebacterium flavescens]